MTFEGTRNFAPTWSPDGRWIGFASNRDGKLNMYRKMADGSRKVRRLRASPFIEVPGSWSPDGGRLAFVRSSSIQDFSLWILPMEVKQEAYSLVELRGPVLLPRFSPDGRWIAFAVHLLTNGRPSGVYQLYVCDSRQPKAEWLIAQTTGAPEARWSPDGKELSYLSVVGAGRELHVVNIETQPTFRVGKPEIQVKGRWIQSNVGFSPDGKRFLLCERPPREPDRIHVVVNWTQELVRTLETMPAPETSRAVVF